jgi:hypothetical protein
MAVRAGNFYPVTLNDLALAARRGNEDRLRELEALRSDRFELMARLAQLPSDTVFYTQITKGSLRHQPGGHTAQCCSCSPGGFGTSQCRRTASSLRFPRPLTDTSGLWFPEPVEGSQSPRRSIVSLTADRTVIEGILHHLKLWDRQEHPPPLQPVSTPFSSNPCSDAPTRRHGERIPHTFTREPPYDLTSG